MYACEALQGGLVLAKRSAIRFGRGLGVEPEQRLLSIVNKITSTRFHASERRSNVGRASSVARLLIGEAVFGLEVMGDGYHPRV